MEQAKKIVVHIITGLNDGGAENILYRLCVSDAHVVHIVISMMDAGKYGPLLDQAGVRVICLGMPAGKVTLMGFYKLWKKLRNIRPPIVQTWMYHANLIGGLGAKLAGVPRVFWGIHHSNLAPGTVKRSTIWVAKLCAKLSHFIPTHIISCSKQAVPVHVGIGYAEQKFLVIPNGYDLANFQPHRASGEKIRRELGINANQFLVGMVARFDPQKDHRNLFNALACLIELKVDVQCVLVGTGMDKENHQLVQWLTEAGCWARVHLLGRRSDIPAVMSTLDLHVLSSLGEAFPNVLAEAMACGTPCVTTDVGDAALIVGETGWVVPPRDSTALANAVIKALGEKQAGVEWSTRQSAARQRIVDLFNIETMVESYRIAWKIKA
nr:glycosyltransferase [uncultured Halomonas sp.]